MKSNKIAPLFLLILAFLAGCSGGSGGGSNAPAKTLVSISITPSTSSIALGMMQQFIATGVYSDNTRQDVTIAVTWSSSTTTVATISNQLGSNGLASPSVPGATTITASLGSITSNSATLTVTAPKLVSITVTPADASIPTSTTLQYTAIGSYSDASTLDITASVAWSSSDPNVATINTAGLATSLSATVVTAATATTTISATSGNVSGSATLTVTGGTAAITANVMPITVNGSLCNAANSTGYANKPCVSVTICAPGSTTDCQTINDILLDTGSYGLRIFANSSPSTPLLTVPLPAVVSGSGFLANCAQFADGSADWGPVKLADIVLGNERAVSVPIQVIDATFGTVPSSCGTPDQYPGDIPGAGFNGILGVGVFAQDCGVGCAPNPGNPNNANNGLYYSCNGTTCTGTTVALADQVTNPVALLPTDNNGVIVQLPSVGQSGTTSVNGLLVLGIDTQSNNSSSGATRYNADGVGQISTIFNGTTSGSIIDSGSNGLFFTPPPGNLLPDCGGANAAWFCPSSLTSLSATNEGFSGTPSNNVMFQIGNFTSLTSGSNRVFSNIGGGVPAVAGIFDWGLPFYFGRNVYVGFENPPGSGNGQYFAY